jgi:ATP-dependent Lon protease
LNDIRQLKAVLGEPRRDEDMGVNGVGKMTGLAWSMVGGSTLDLEAISYPSKKGGYILTGMAADVMKESMQVAYGYVRAHAEELGIKQEWFEQNTIQIHLPAGSTPKDGPSAGGAFSALIASIATGLPIRQDFAMTGEMTLRGHGTSGGGRLTAIGGLDQKLTAAFTNKIKDLIIPVANLRDVKTAPREVLDNIWVEGTTKPEKPRAMTIHPMDSISDVIKFAVPGIGEKKPGSAGGAPSDTAD